VIELTDGQNELFIQIMEKVSVSGKAVFATVRFVGGPKHVVCSTASTHEKGVSLVFNLPEDGHIFLAATRRHPKEVRRVVAEVADYDQRDARLKPYDTFAIPGHAFLKRTGVARILFLEPDLLPWLDGFGAHIGTALRNYHALLCFFIDSEENELRKSQGVEALLDRWDAQKRDPVLYP
jgi:hypothetical protein